MSAKPAYCEYYYCQGHDMTWTPENHAACGQGCRDRGCTDELTYAGLRADNERLRAESTAREEQWRAWQKKTLAAWAAEVEQWRARVEALDRDAGG